MWRHLPLNDVHPNAQLAAEAAEAAAAQGKFWEMHDVLLDHQHATSRCDDLLRYADVLDLDRRTVPKILRTHARVAVSPRTSTRPT